MDEIIEAAFEVTDCRYPFVGVSDRTGCRFALEKFVPTAGEAYLELFEVTEVAGSRVSTLLEREFDVEFEMVKEGDTRNFVLLTVDEARACPVATLGEEGAVWQSARAEDGVGEIVVLLPSAEAWDAFERLEAEHSSLELRTKQTQRPQDLHFLDGSSQFVERRLTDRQLEVLQTAVRNGYFEHPRDVTGSDLADQFGITQTTFSQHLRAAQSKIFNGLPELESALTQDAEE